VAQRLIDAGLPILGKSNTAQFGLSYSTEPQDLHATANPWDQRLSAGGSSGGAGAAVAAGYVPLAHASDGGGSIRVPASVNGLVGLKPSRGRVPMGPVIGEAWSGLATNLVVSRSVRDTAAALDVMAGPEPGDPYAGPPAPDSWLAAAAAPPGRLRIALMTEASATWPSDPLCVQAARDAATLLTELGHTVDAAAPELDRDAFARAFLDTIAGHALDDLSLLAERVLGRAFEPEDVEPMTAAIAEHGRRVGVLGHIRGRTELQIAGRALGRFHRDWDLILTPTLAVPPWPLGAIDHAETDIDRIMAQLAGRSPFTQLANANGAPAISLPLFWTDAGLPIGVMLQAPLGGEATLLQVAAQCEAARPWAHRRPEISGS
jgi:Asp-tRNA(Asn)/Glu-tRNA(Gln) amidotransferase A subunit family amidase